LSEPTLAATKSINVALDLGVDSVPKSGYRGEQGWLENCEIFCELEGITLVESNLATFNISKVREALLERVRIRQVADNRVFPSQWNHVLNLKAG
jgi:hypothetical protein